MSTSNIAPVTFSGSSTFSSSFQQVLTRAVAIASLPEQSLQNDVSNLQSKQSAVSVLGGDFTALQNALQVIGSATAGSRTAQVSDSSIVSATATPGALAGKYQIQVDDTGSSTTTLSSASLTTVTDPSTSNISSASGFTLTLNGVSTTITPTGASLEDLASAINQAGAGVQATIVNVGSNTSPDYRLAVTSNNLGADSIQLGDGTNNALLDTLSPGSDATYQVNGSSTILQSTSNQITLSPGLTVNLLAHSSSPVTITISSDFTGLASALQNFASAYNATLAAVQQNRGQGGGTLTGDSIISTATDVLTQIGQFISGSGAITNLASLGLAFDNTGNLDFNSSTLAAANIGDIQNFLGDINSSGFLDVANNALKSITDPTSGAVASEYKSFGDQIAGDNSKLADDRSRVNELASSLQTQLARADAAIATLQAQNAYFQELFQAEYGNNNSNGG